jgi:ubiquitin
MNIFDLKASLPSLICDDYPIQIRSLTGKETLIKVHHKMRVSELKEIIEKQDQTPFDQQRLVYNGKQLEDERTLDYYNITQDTVVHIILRIRGGMFHETSARKDFELVQWTLESIEELEEKIRLLKLNM